jgi:hypothetical protein
MRRQQGNEQDARYPERGAGPQVGKQQNQIKGYKHPCAQLGVAAPLGYDEEILLEDAGDGVGKGLYRRHGGGHRSLAEIAQPGSRSAYQHDLVTELLRRNAAAVDVIKGVHRKGGFVAVAGVEEGVHTQMRVGADVESSQTHTLTQGYLDVGRAQIEALGGQLQGDGREVLVVVAQHQRFLAAAAIHIQKLRQMTDGEGLTADLRDGRSLCRSGRWRLHRRVVSRRAAHIIDCISGHKIGQGRVGISLGLADFEGHGQDHIAGPGETGGENRIVIEGLARFVELAAEGRNSHAGGGIDGAQLFNVLETRINLRL